ncbi:MAG TPA: cellulase family glycosylhydrolase, partial [Gaiellaceae bacterium]
MRRSTASGIGRSAAVLVLVALSSAPLAAAGPARHGDQWTLVRLHAKKTGRAHVTRTEESARGGGKKSVGTFARAGFSIGGGFQNESDTDMARDLDSMKDAGARWIRMDVNWAVIQAGGPSSYGWAPFDRVAAAARARGLSVLAEIVYTPSWAQPAGAPAESPPANLDDYARFAAAAAAHYAPLGVHAYEIWNEPNNASFWRPRADVVRYTAMLRAAYPAIKAADPGAVVVTGGMSPAVDDGRNVAPLNFLRGIYANGGKAFFDAVGHH